MIILLLCDTDNRTIQDIHWAGIEPVSSECFSCRNPLCHYFGNGIADFGSYKLLRKRVQLLLSEYI